MLLPTFQSGSASGKKAAHNSTNTACWQVKGQCSFWRPVAALFESAARKQPLLESAAQSRPWADALDNVQASRSQFPAGILRTFSSVHERHRVADLAEDRWRRSAFSLADKVIQRKLWSHVESRRRVTRARVHRSLWAKSRQRRIFPWKTRNRRARLESRRDREQP